MSAQQNSGYHMKCTVKLSEKTPSCVRRLIQYVPGTLVNVAPEKFDKLAQALGKSDLELEMIESQDLVHEFLPKTKKNRIRLSTRLLELLWAQSYAYFVWYSEKLANVQPSGQQIDPHREPEVHRALKLLRWATEETVRRHRQPWPGDAPSPEPKPVNQSYAHVAQELSLFAVGFILHHELGHYRLQHQPVRDIDQEREADYGAIDWAIDGIDAGAPEFKKRALGASVALLYLVVNGIYTGQHDGQSHPKDYNRLMYTLERHVPSKRDDIWAFVAGMLSLFMQDAGMRPSGRSHDNFYQWCNDLVEDLARRERLQDGGRTT